MVGKAISYMSLDWPVAYEDALDSLPAGFLNKIQFPGFPNHSLTLKVGMPIILFRNLSLL
jgi:hypothetical protein